METKIKLFSPEIERACLSAAINFQSKLADVVGVIDGSFFYFEPHQVIFNCIKGFVGQKFDTVILIEKIHSLGLTKVEDIPLGDYIISISKLNSISEDSFFEYFGQLKKYKTARDLDSTCRKIQDFVKKNISQNSSTLVTGSENIFGESVNNYELENEPKNFLAGLKEEIELRGNEPKEDGVINPFPQMKKYYGNFLFGGLYVFAAPAKNGKSTLLQSIQDSVTKDGETMTLYLDTELTIEEERNRYVASLSGVNEYYIRTGKFRYDQDMLKKVRAIWPEVEKRAKQGMMEHLYVAGKPIDEIVSIARRWKYKNIKKAKRFAVFYDYIKLTGEKISDSWKEYQVIGQKVDKLKQLAQELKLPIISAIQTNASNDVAMSKQIKWFCNMLAMFGKKSPEELALFGDKFGSHKMVVTESRNQGEGALGFQDLVKMPDGSFERMFINFDIQSFRVAEKGTLLDIVDGLNGNVSLSDHHAPEVETEIF